MCRLFGLHAGLVDVPATFWLLDAAGSLVVQSHCNPDGAGIGVFGPGGALLLDKQPIAAWRDAEFVSAARELRGTTFVAHVRYASIGALSVVDTHPFAQDGRLFAHNGVVLDLPLLDERLEQVGATGLVLGHTDSERVFALITAEIRRHGGDVGAGLRAAVGWVAEELPVYALNFLLATATDLWAVRFPETHSLYVLERPAGGTVAGRALDARGTRIRAHSEHLAGSASVLVASERLDEDPGWRLLGSGELLHVDAGLRVESSRPFPVSPRRLLRIDELDAAQVASQHPELARSR